MTPKVTIGIPFHNSARTIGDAVRSVFAQSYTDWELILVDDGSTDGSFDRVSDIADPRVRLVRDGANLKLPARLNQIAELARGEYLARMDADDLMHPERLERQLSCFDANPSCDVLGSAHCVITAAGSPVRVEWFPNEPIPARRLLSHGIMSHPSVMAKTSWFRANPYSIAYPRAEDHELWVRTYGSSSIRNLDEPLMFVRTVGTVTAAKYAASARDTREIIRTYGPERIGRLELASMIAASHAKEWTYRVLERIGRVDLAVARRGEPLTANQQRAFREVVTRMLAVHVPTVDRQRQPV